jgi:hypothetical protein
MDERMPSALAGALRAALSLVIDRRPPCRAVPVFHVPEICRCEKIDNRCNTSLHFFDLCVNMDQQQR